MTTATEKQVRYALHLLTQAGYRTTWMSSDYRALGATMRERSGSVESWLRSLDITRMSSLIDALKR